MNGTTNFAADLHRRGNVRARKKSLAKNFYMPLKSAKPSKGVSSAAVSRNRANFSSSGHQGIGQSIEVGKRKEGKEECRHFN